MKKHEFLESLRDGLSEWPKADTERFIEYYGEMIDDRMEGGMSEEGAVEALGSPESVICEIMFEIPLPKIVKNKFKKKTPWRISEILFLILGSPIWLSLLITVFACALTLYICFWSVLAVFWIAGTTLFGWGIGGTAVAIALITGGSFMTGLVYLGSALVSAALCILGFLASIKVSKLFWQGNTMMIRGIKRLLLGGGKKNEKN